MAAHRSRVLAVASIFAASLASGQQADPRSLAKQAGLAMKGRDFARAERLYRELAQLFPDEPGMALNLGLAQFSSGRFEDAAEQFERFLARGPSQGPASQLGCCSGCRTRD